MAHTTHGYYRDRLGFEPEAEPPLQHASKTTREQLTRRTTTTTKTTTERTAASSVSGTTVVAASSSRQQEHHYVGTHVGNGRTDAVWRGGVYVDNLKIFIGWVWGWVGKVVSQVCAAHTYYYYQEGRSRAIVP